MTGSDSRLVASERKIEWILSQLRRLRQQLAGINQTPVAFAGGGGSVEAGGPPAPGVRLGYIAAAVEAATAGQQAQPASVQAFDVDSKSGAITEAETLDCWNDFPAAIPAESWVRLAWQPNVSGTGIGSWVIAEVCCPPANATPAGS